MPRAASIASVAEKGDRAATLTALRNRLAREIDQCDGSPRDVAVLSVRLVDVLAQLAAIDKPKVRTVDQLATKRARRQRRAAATR